MAKGLTDEQNAHVRAFAREAMGEHGTVTELAEAMGVTQPTVSRLLGSKKEGRPSEGGGTTFPTAKLLAKHLGLNVEAMLRGERVRAGSVRDLPGYAAARAAAADPRYSEGVLDAATRVLDAVGAMTVTAESMRAAVAFALAHMAPSVPAVPLVPPVEIIKPGKGTAAEAARAGIVDAKQPTKKKRAKT